ncbi:hypothetical protein PUNSTDRAFT_53691 [Punctularia strigosozonata HHB-11173 SS5]|uniref:uncharacterized protein n=1 Tax=Punctularia strigosozonata (strain HHB-11173) TaxID=741275 RepID=UPI0004417E8D|nr:uncharacterized protein PUNSTDRAFT_53691 [Punctularia strigosozonata HHB-11173 SS5]EIN07544.1 hypothetical protein PUNSTDRAFT_53691 [Punctularia strigosozonata HHB-11173 SS5]
MAVADEYESGSMSGSMPRPQVASVPHQQQQQAYPPYYSNHGGQLDFGAYGYAPAPAPEAAVYGAAGVAAATTPFYDYSARAASSQFYYPSTPLMWNPAASPMLTPQMPAAAAPATLSDKKRELQYNLQQNAAQMHHQNMIYSPLRSTPSPHPHQAYAPALDYGAAVGMHAQVPMMGPAYGHARRGSQQGVLQQPPQQPQGYAMPRGAMRREDGGAQRSALLEEFRANKARKWELADIAGHVAEFGGDQHGSRFIQQKLEGASAEEREAVFAEIVPGGHALQLTQDVFGNYVVQKLLEHCSPAQRVAIAECLSDHVLALSLQMYGCRVVQKALEYLPESHQAKFVRELEPHVIRCVKDANGNHVIQKIIERVNPSLLTFVNGFQSHVFELASHPYGCRVLQRCLEYLSPEQTRGLLAELHECTIQLMQDQFGNYVIQFVLEHGAPQDRAEVVQKLRGQMLPMARHKFASNVCEKALVTAEPDSRRALIDEILAQGADGSSPIVTMMKDQYANYVLQRAVSTAEPDQQETLISRIRPQLLTMRRYNNAYTKHLIAIERLLDKCAKAQLASQP